MATYKILSDRISLGKKNTVLDETAFDDANVSALVEAGHIAPVSKSTKTETQETEETKDK